MRDALETKEIHKARRQARVAFLAKVEAERPRTRGELKTEAKIGVAERARARAEALAAKCPTTKEGRAVLAKARAKAKAKEQAARAAKVYARLETIIAKNRAERQALIQFRILHPFKALKVA